MPAVHLALHQQARKSSPRRWSGPTRNWTPIGAVTLNLERDSIAAASQTLLSGSTDGSALSSRLGSLTRSGTASTPALRIGDPVTKSARQPL